MKKFICISILAFTLINGCTKDELAFDVVESPVLAIFDDMSSDDMLRVKGTFYELDKSGLLDHQIGIDSIPVEALPVTIFIHEKDEIGAGMTDGSGQFIFEIGYSEIPGIDQIEWTGVYNDIAFRIYYKF